MLTGKKLHVLFLLLFLFSFCTTGNSQNRKVEEDKDQINKLVDKADTLLDEGDIEQARQAAELAVAMAREGNNQDLLVDALYSTAEIYFHEGDYLTARKLYREILPKVNRDHDIKTYLGTIESLGACNGHLSDNDKATEYYFEALKIYEEKEDPVGITYQLNNLAVIYDNMNNRDKTIEYYRKALKVARDNDLKIGQALALSNLGAVYIDLEDYEKAIEYLEPAIDLATEEEDNQLIIYILTSMGKISLNIEHYKDGIEVLELALEIARDENYGKDEYHALMLLAETEAKLGNFNKAFDYANQCDALIERLNLIAEKYDTILLRSKIYSAQGNYKKAYELLAEYQTIYEDAWNEESEKIIHDLQARYDTELKDNEIALLQRENEVKALEIKSQQDLVLSLVTGLALITIMALIAVRFYRMKVKANREIKLKNEALSAAYEKMEELAKTDPLTGLVNRRFLYEVVNYEASRQERNNRTHSFIICDVDHFKQVNDSYGHEVGDQALIWLAKLIKNSMRKQDVLCRWGGEEFLLFLPDTDFKGAEKLADKMHSIISEAKLKADDLELDITMTFGFAEWGKGTSANEAIHHADVALYKGKTAGRNRVTPFDPLLLQEQ